MPGAPVSPTFGVDRTRQTLQRQLKDLQRQLKAAQAPPPATPAPAPAPTTPTVQPFTGDLRRYGEMGGEHPWFPNTLGPEGPIPMGTPAPMPGNAAMGTPSLASALGVDAGGMLPPAPQPPAVPGGTNPTRDFLRNLYPSIFGVTPQPGG